MAELTLDYHSPSTPLPTEYYYPYYNQPYYPPVHQRLVLDDGEGDLVGPTYAMSPAALRPYVAVGPTDELSVTMHKSTFDKLVIVVILTFVLFAIPP